MNCIAQIIFFLSQVMINLVCNILCVILYSMVFYEYFRMQKTSGGSKGKGELSLVCIGAMIFAVNVLFTVYSLLTVVAIFTGADANE